MICGMDCLGQVVNPGKCVSELSFWCPDTPQRNRNNIPDLLGATSMTVSVNARKISNYSAHFIRCFGPKKITIAVR